MNAPYKTNILGEYLVRSEACLQLATVNSLTSPLHSLVTIDANVANQP
jgi:hypothetical protein